MRYVDGFVVPVKSEDKERYRAAAVVVNAKLRAWGALRQVECWGDDVRDGKHTDFKRAVDAEPGETVVYSWIEWPSKEVRDAAQTKMMEDPEMQTLDMPFDGRRMIVGGFATLYDSASG